MARQYIGTKIVTAWPAKHQATGEEGYAVKYADGYISWSPTSTFEDAYRAIGHSDQRLTFGDAIHMLKRGYKLTRAGWNGKGMFIFLVQSSSFKVNRPPLLGIYPEGTVISYRPHIDMSGVDGSISTWSPTNNDVLAEDWMVLQ